MSFKGTDGVGGFMIRLCSISNVRVARQLLMQIALFGNILLRTIYQCRLVAF